MHHCGNYLKRPVSRREMLATCANGFGAVALAALLGDRAYGAAADTQPAAGKLPFTAKARNIIFLYMDGGPSQVDTFDPKPRLRAEHGKPFGMKVQPTQIDVGTTLGSPWEFKNYGQCGMPVSSLFPHVAECVDDLCLIRSMTSEFVEHATANYFLHTGVGIAGRPSMGAWMNYGLGSESKNLPGFVVLNGGLIPAGGLDCFGNGFLPATYQGSVFKPNENPVANIKPTEAMPQLQENKFALMRKLDGEVLDHVGHVDQLESAIANYEMAFKMQSALPELMDFKGESEATKKLYGMDSTTGATRTFATECLIARRLVERGVRFIELTCPNIGTNRWDQHAALKKGHELNSRAVDQPIAGLLKDLKSRGLLDQTLVVWAGEFGRTPFAQGSDGRDDSPYGFTIWMAGGGVKPGLIYGATDDYGYHAIENKMTMHDFHATLLYLLGIEHTSLTYRFSGRDMRLTDIAGNVVKELIA